MNIKYMLEYLIELQRNYVIGETLSKYYQEGKKAQFERLIADKGNDYVYGFSVLCDMRDNPANYENSLVTSSYFKEIEKHTDKNNLIAKIIVLSMGVEEELALFHNLMRDYSSLPTGSDYGEMILRLCHKGRYAIARELVDKNLAIIPADYIARIAIYETIAEPLDIEHLKKLVISSSNTASVEVRALLAFKLMISSNPDVKKLNKFILCDEVIDAMLPAVCADFGVMPVPLINKIYIETHEYKHRLLANILLYGEVNIVDFMTNESKINAVIPEIISNGAETVLAQIVRHFSIPRFGEHDLHNKFFVAADFSLPVMSHLLELSNKHLKKDDREEYYNMLFSCFFMHLCALDKIVEEEILCEIFETAEQKYDNHLIGYLAKIINNQLNINYKIKGEYELSAEGKELFVKTGYYMAKNLEGASIAILKTIWPKPDKAYGIYENCDFPTYLAINLAFARNDTQTIENIFGIFNAERNPGIIAGFLAHDSKNDAEVTKFDYVFAFIKKLPTRQQDQSFKRIFNVLDLGNNINDYKLALLTQFFNDSEIHNDTKAYVFELVSHDIGLIRKLFSSSYVSNKLAGIIANSEHQDHVRIIEWINDAKDEELDKFAAIHISGTCRVENLRSVLFTHYIAKADIKIVPRRIREYIDSNSDDISIEIADSLIMLKSSKALECLLSSNKILMNVLEQADLLMKSIEIADEDCINVISKFIAKANHLDSGYYNIWEILILLFRAITFSMPTKQEEVGKNLAKLYIGQDQTIITFTKLHEVIESNGLKDPASIFDILSYSMIYCNSQKDLKSVKAFSDICASIIRRYPDVDVNATFKKIGYNRMQALSKLEHADLNEIFMEKILDFTQKEYTTMSWVGRLTCTKPKEVQIS